MGKHLETRVSMGKHLETRVNPQNIHLFMVLYHAISRLAMRQSDITMCIYYRATAFTTIWVSYISNFIALGPL